MRILSNLDEAFSDTQEFYDMRDMFEKVMQKDFPRVRLERYPRDENLKRPKGQFYLGEANKYFKIYMHGYSNGRRAYL